MAFSKSHYWDIMEAFWIFSILSLFIYIKSIAFTQLTITKDYHHYLIRFSLFSLNVATYFLSCFIISFYFFISYFIYFHFKWYPLSLLSGEFPHRSKQGEDFF